MISTKRSRRNATSWRRPSARRLCCRSAWRAWVLTSDQLDAILRDRVTVEKYLDFRFRAFVLISPKEITDRYNQEYARLRNSGRIVPTLDQARSQIEQELTEEKIASEIDTFVDSLREQPGTEIVIISPV